MKFTITDERPWYKQAITGVFNFIGLAFLAGLANGVITIALMLSKYGIPVIFSFIFKIIGALVLTLVAVFFIFMLYEWASSKY